MTDKIVQWVMASVHTRLSEAGYPVMLPSDDGHPEATNTYLEVAVDGPQLRDQGSSTKVSFTVLCVIASSDSDLYAVEKVAGNVIGRLESFPIAKYGDDKTVLQCVTPSDEIDYQDLGRGQDIWKLASLTASYEFTI